MGLENYIYDRRRIERFLKSIWISFYWEFVQCRHQCSLLTGESSDQAFAMPIAHSNTSFLRGSLRAKQALLKAVKLKVESRAVVKTWNLLPWLWLKCSLQLVKLSISTGKTSNKRRKYKQKLFSLCSFEEKFCFYCLVFITSTFSIWASRNCQYLLPVGTLFSPKFVCHVGFFKGRVSLIFFILS